MSYNIYSRDKGDITLDCIDETIFIKSICTDRTINEDYLTNMVLPYMSSSWQLTIELYNKLDISVLQYIRKNINSCSVTIWLNEKNCNPLPLETYKDLIMEKYPDNKIIHMCARDRIPR